MKYKILFLLTLVSANILSANDEFFVSYKAVVKNQILTNEQYYISKALSKSDGWQVIGECEFIDSSNTNILDENDVEQGDLFNDKPSATLLKKILEANKDNVLECLHREIDAYIRDDIKSINNALNSKTNFEYKPQRIKVKYDDNKINIRFLEQIK
ncbi:MAG: hypothetical protein K2P17_04055 [Helicobacteraceae bacterium]|nr:hypothetical protein [Helicobacteraceae bacterium]